MIVTARRGDRLEALRSELEKDYGVSVRTIQQDLSEADSAKRIFDRVQESGDLVRVLVNNAGMGHYGAAIEQTVENIERMIQVNLASVTGLTRLFGAQMKAAGGGYILQNASFSGFVPIPRYAIYAATKSYLVSMGLAMRYELRKSGVHTSVLCPGFAGSGFLEAAGHEVTGLIRLIELDPQKVAEAGIAGLFRRQALIVPGAVYKIYGLLLRVLPRYAACALAAGLVKNRAPRS